MECGCLAACTDHSWLLCGPCGPCFQILILMILGASLILRKSEMQMFLKWKVAAVRHVKQQSGKADVGRN